MQTLKKIDIHVHSVPYRFIPVEGELYATPDEIRHIYDLYNIEGGVLLAEGTFPECAQEVTSMREAHQMATTRPDVFVGWFCNIHPRMIRNLPDTDLSALLMKYREKGARGIGEVEYNVPFDNPFLCNLMRHAEKCNMPMIFHIGVQGGDYGIVDSLGLPGLEWALQHFPRLRFLGHSQKFWAHMSADVSEESWTGYPGGKVIPGGRITYLLDKYENLSCDLSAGSGYNALSRDPEFAAHFIETYQDRLFFGTDICSPNNINDSRVMLSGFLDSLMQEGKISYDAYEKVSRKNALALLSMNS